MHRKIREVDCSADQAATLGRALVAYVDAAYPAGGSECTQVSRETLLETARQCAAHQGGTLPLRRRQFAQLRAAMRWYLAECAGEDEPLATTVADALSR